MKRFTLTLISVCMVVLSYGQAYIDNFNTYGPLGRGIENWSNWTLVTHGSNNYTGGPFYFCITSYGGSYTLYCSGTADNAMMYVGGGGDLMDDQYAQVTYIKEYGSLAMGVAVRMNTVNGGNYYGWSSDSTKSYFFKVINGFKFIMATGLSWTMNDVVKLVAKRNVLYFYRNGILDASISGDGIVTDIDIPGNYPSHSYAGIVAYGASDINNNLYTLIDNFECGNSGDVLTGGVIGQSIYTTCYNDDPGYFTNQYGALGGSRYYIYQWQKSTTSSQPGVGVWTDIPGATGVAYNPSDGITSTTYFVRKVYDAFTIAYSNVATITARTELLGGTIATSATQCNGVNPAVLTSTVNASGGSGGLTYAWETRPPGGTWTLISTMASSNVYDPPALYTTTEYRRRVNDNYCYAYSNTVTITVRDPLQAGVIADSRTVSSGANLPAFRSITPANGGTGSYTYAWQYSTTTTVPGAATGWTTINSSNSTTYDYGTIAERTYFVRRVTDATCGTVYSNVLDERISIASFTAPMAYYKLDESSGLVAVEEISSGNNGTTGAGVTVNQTGMFGTGYAFNGANNSRITVPNNSVFEFAAENFTVRAWIYPTNLTLQTQNGIVGGQDNCMTIFIDNNRKLVLGKNNYNNATPSTMAVTLNQWNYIAVSYNQTTNTVLYCVNGDVQTLTNYSTEFTAGAYSNLIGQMYNNVQKFIGTIDEIAYFNSALSSSDLTVDYNYGTGQTYPWPGGEVVSKPRKMKANNLLSYNRVYRALDEVTPPQPPANDTIEYLFAETFTGWTNSSVNTADSLEKRWPIAYTNNHFSQLSIENTGGTHGNVWRGYIKSYAHAPTDCWNSFAFDVCLMDTASDIWMSADVYMDPNFLAAGMGGSTSYKASTGFTAGNNIDFAANYPGGIVDTVTVSGRAGWFHDVGGSNQMAYIYNQDMIPFIEGNAGHVWWDGFVRADSGYWSRPLGVWQNVIHHWYVGKPSTHDAICEVYINGILTARYTHFKFRSQTQEFHAGDGGKDFGKVEMINMSFFHGGSENYNYAAQSDEWIRLDNFVVWKYKPGAVNFTPKAHALGHRISQVTPPVDSYKKPSLFTDETYTADHDTVYDAGNNKFYILNPPNNHGYTTKVINVTGTVNYRFVTAEWGYGPDEPNQDAWVKVYSGVGAGKVLQHTFGRTSRNGLPAYEAPSGTYSITGPFTIEIHSGWSTGVTKSQAIKYDKQ
jgi:hypothetical protein